MGSGTDGDRKLLQALSRGGWHPSFSWRRTEGIKAREEGGKGVRRGGWEKPRVRGPRRRSTGKEERQRQRTGRGRREDVPLTRSLGKCWLGRRHLNRKPGCPAKEGWMAVGFGG